MKYKKIGIAFFAMILIISLTIGGYFYTSQSTIENLYPNPDDIIYRPLYGALECRYNGRVGTYINDVQMAELSRVLDYLKIVYQNVECPDWVGSKGCSVNFANTACSGQVYIRINDGAKQTLQSKYNQDAGQTTKYQISCEGAAFGGFTPNKPTYTVKYNEQQIYLNDPNGYNKIGFIAGTAPRCNLVKSNDINIIKNMQPQDKPIINMQIGDSISIVTGWREDPAFGNINPLEQYDNKDVVCTFDGLTEAKLIRTVGGKNYYAIGDQLLNFRTTDRKGCCEKSMCPSGYSCENYECTQNPIICDEGQCNFWQKGTVLEKEKEEWDKINNKFYLTTVECDNNGCIHTTKEDVACTQQYCDQVASAQGGLQDYECDYTKGCLSIGIVKNPCPVGQCCLVGNEQYYARPECDNNQECCVADIPSDPLRGMCKDSCNNVAEICSNGIDDDKNGLTDAEDPACNVCIIDGENLKLSPRECCDAKGDTWIVEQKTIAGIPIPGQTIERCVHCDFFGKIFNEDCGGTGMSWLAILGGLLSGLIMFLILDKKDRKKNKILNILISLVFGALIFFIIFKLVIYLATAGGLVGFFRFLLGL